MSNFNLNNDANNNPPKRERLPERTTRQIMEDLNIERDCIFNADRFENNMCEISSRFGAEIGVKFAYEIDIIEEECRQKYSDEIKNLSQQKELAKRNAELMSELAEHYKSLLNGIEKQLNFEENIDFNDQLNSHIKDFNSLFNIAKSKEQEVAYLKSEKDKIINDATIQRVRQEEYIKQMKDTTNGALNASSLSNQKYEDLRFKVAELLAYFGKTNALDLTQRRMAKILGISESQLSRLVNRNN